MKSSKAGFPEIQRKLNLSEEVSRHIKESILNGEFKSGDALPSENQLADQFGVSRIVIREALKSLKSEGLVETRRGPKGGPFVAMFDKLTLGVQFTNMIRLRQMTVAQLYQARILFEPEIVRLVLNATTDEQIGLLRKHVEKTLKTKDLQSWRELSMEFHRKLGHLSGNPFYALLMDSFMDFLVSFLEMLNPDTSSLHEDREHEDIVEAIADRDEVKAVSLMTNHLIKDRDRLVKLEQEYLTRVGRVAG